MSKCKEKILILKLELQFSECIEKTLIFKLEFLFSECIEQNVQYILLPTTKNLPPHSMEVWELETIQFLHENLYCLLSIF